MGKKTIVFDFDGVIHLGYKGWKDGTIYGTINWRLLDYIEELKEDNKHQWEERCKLTFELENSTSNDKIKAKIEELDKQEKEVLKGTKGQDRYAIKQEYMYKRSVLQSLLEKE